MLNKFFLASVFVLFLSSLAFATQLRVVSPVSYVLDSNTQVLDLGVIGPGQTLEVVADRDSGIVSEQSETKGEALWDQVFVVRDGLPSGWSAEDSKLFEKTFHAFVTAAKDAGDGEFFFQLKAIDQYEGAGERVFNAKVRVSKDLFEQTLGASKLETGVGLPAVFPLKLKNKSSASDIFEVKAVGIANSWSETKKVFIKFNSEADVDFEVLPSDQGSFSFSIKSTSLSSPLIYGESQAYVKASSSIEQDLRSLRRGLLLFPAVEQVVYSALAVVSHLVFR